MRRKHLFKEMLDQNKRRSSVLKVYRLIWLIEERGLSLAEAKRVYRLDANSYQRHVFRLYLLRRDLFDQLGMAYYASFGKAI